MSSKAKASNTSAFPPGISKPALRALAGAGYVRLEQLTQARAADLSQLHGFGPKALRLLQEALTQRGLSLKND